MAQPLPVPGRLINHHPKTKYLQHSRTLTLETDRGGPWFSNLLLPHSIEKPQCNYTHSSSLSIPHSNSQSSSSSSLLPFVPSPTPFGKRIGDRLRYDRCPGCLRIGSSAGSGFRKKSTNCALTRRAVIFLDS